MYILTKFGCAKEEMLQLPLKACLFIEIMD